MPKSCLIHQTLRSNFCTTQSVTCCLWCSSSTLGSPAQACLVCQQIHRFWKNLFSIWFSWWLRGLTCFFCISKYRDVRWVGWNCQFGLIGISQTFGLIRSPWLMLPLLSYDFLSLSAASQSACQKWWFLPTPISLHDPLHHQTVHLQASFKFFVFS